MSKQKSRKTTNTKKAKAAGLSTIGSRIRIARQANRMTMVQLADQTKIQQPRLSTYESNEVTPDLETMIVLANALNASLDYLTGRTPVNLSPANPMYQELFKLIAGQSEEHKKMILAWARFVDRDQPLS